MSVDDFETWARDFRHDEPAGEHRAVRLPSEGEILELSARDARRERRGLAIHLGSLLFATLVFAWVVVHTRATLFAIFAAIVLPTLFGTFVLTLYFRQLVGKARGESLVVQIDLAVRRKRANHLSVQVGLGAFGVLTAAFWSWWPFVIVANVDKYGEPWRLVTLISVAVLVFASTWWFVLTSAKRARSELLAWQAVQSALRDPDSDTKG